MIILISNKFMSARRFIIIKIFMSSNCMCDAINQSNIIQVALEANKSNIINRSGSWF